MTPLTNKPSIYGRKIADTIDNPQGEGGYGRGFLAGAAEGAGDLISGMTSPMSLAGMALGAAPWMRGAQQLTSLGRMVPKSSPPMGVGPSPSLIPDLVAVGDEGAYNAARSIFSKPMRSADEVAYENIMRQGGRSSSNNSLLLDHMQRVQAAKASGLGR